MAIIKIATTESVDTPVMMMSTLTQRTQLLVSHVEDQRPEMVLSETVCTVEKKLEWEAKFFVLNVMLHSSHQLMDSHVSTLTVKESMLSIRTSVLNAPQDTT